MTNYDSANTDDVAGAFSKMGNIKMEFNTSNVSFLLTQLEIKMGFCRIGKQYTKLQALTSLLLGDIAEELQPWLNVQKSEASNLCYKEAKDQLLEQYGPKEGYNFRLAMGLMLVTTPSALARKIVDLICTHKRKPMEACCCKETVSGIWTAKLPENVRTAIANESLGWGNLPKVLQIDNAVY